MPEPIVITAAIVAAVLVATIIAIYLRFFDDPVTDLPEDQKKRLSAIVKMVVGIFLAVVIGAWMMLEQGLDLWLLQNFIMLVVFGAGGIGSVKAIFNVAKKLMPG